jgi:hypothetical protein
VKKYCRFEEISTLYWEKLGVLKEREPKLEMECDSKSTGQIEK